MSTKHHSKICNGGRQLLQSNWVQNQVAVATSVGMNSIQSIITSLQMCSKTAPISLQEELFSVNSYDRVGLHSSQDDYKLYIPRVKRETFANRSFKVVGPRWWNNLPIDIQRSTSVITFKKQLKPTFLNFIIRIIWVKLKLTHIFVFYLFSNVIHIYIVVKHHWNYGLVRLYQTIK